MKKPYIVQSSDDEFEQGMELSGCNDSKKVADEVSKIRECELEGFG